MGRYVVDFEWVEPPVVGERSRRLLDADDDHGAKLEAALMFAVGDFRDAAPVAYRVLEVERGEIYRYPEA